VLCDIVEVLQLLGKWAEAEECYHQALTLTIDEPNQHTQARCQLLLGHLMWYKAAYPDALRWLEQARAGFERIGARRAFSQAIGRMGLVYETQGDYRRALDHLEQQVRIASELGDKDGLAEVFGHIGLVYQDRNEYTQALEWFERQLLIAAESRNRRESLRAVGNMGNIYRYTGDYQKALAHLSRALEIAVEIGDRYSIVSAAINIGEVYRFQGDFVRALISYRYVLDATIDLDERKLTTLTVGNIAYAYAGQGRDEEADYLFDIAITLDRALGLPYSLADDLYGKAELLFAQRRYDEAQAANDEALRVAIQVERRDIHLKAQILDIELRVALGQADRATAARECAAMQEVWPEASEHAAIAYELWRLTGLEEHRRQAAELYREQYAHTPNIEYRQRLAILTGSPPAEPPALPDLPEIITQKRVELDALLRRVDAMVVTVSETISV
jgi:tetratricopeptide (TPR) repeat protein